MPTYDTLTPIDLAVDLSVGHLEVVAGDRTVTVVTVLPSNPARPGDVRGAEETRVDRDGPRVTVTGPRPRLAWVGPNESVDVRVELPTGSRLTAELSLGAVRTSGRLGATRIKSSLGAVELGTTGALSLHATHGNATVGRAEGDIEITADHGQIRIGAVTGASVLKASYGTITVEESGGDLEARLSYGDLEVGRALGSVAARTAYGSIALHEVSSGAVELESGHGGVSVGVRHGVAAWLDLSSKHGQIRNELVSDQAPDASEPTVAVRVRAQLGDIEVRRAAALR
jgi:hypothetical protein